MEKLENFIHIQHCPRNVATGLFFIFFQDIIEAVFNCIFAATKTLFFMLQWFMNLPLCVFIRWQLSLQWQRIKCFQRKQTHVSAFGLCDVGSVPLYIGECSFFFVIWQQTGSDSRSSSYLKEYEKNNWFIKLRIDYLDNHIFSV